jgi:hypothetical protein
MERWPGPVADPMDAPYEIKNVVLEQLLGEGGGQTGHASGAASKRSAEEQPQPRKQRKVGKTTSQLDLFEPFPQNSGCPSVRLLAAPRRALRLTAVPGS